MAKKQQVSQNIQNEEVKVVQQSDVDVAALQQQVEELQAQLCQKDLELKKLAAVSLLKQDPRYRHVVWLDESQVGLVGVAFRRPTNCKNTLKAFVALLWAHQAVFDARLVGNGTLRLEPPQVPGPQNGDGKPTWRPAVVWSDAFKAKLQADVLRAFQQWAKDGDR